jgi:hypothetical protein
VRYLKALLEGKHQSVCACTGFQLLEIPPEIMRITDIKTARAPRLGPHTSRSRALSPRLTQCTQVPNPLRLNPKP